MCSTLTMPVLDGEGSIFPNNNDNTTYPYDQKTIMCHKAMNRTPDFDFVFQEFGGYDIHQDFKNYSKIIFVNGEMDPWLAGCVQT